VPHLDRLQDSPVMSSSHAVHHSAGHPNSCRLALEGSPRNKLSHHPPGRTRGTRSELCGPLLRCNENSALPQSPVKRALAAGEWINETAERETVSRAEPTGSYDACTRLAWWMNGWING
jgi:hypothetical protein